MWPLLVLAGSALYLTRRPRRNPDWYTDAEGRHHPIRNGTGESAKAVPYDRALAGDSATAKVKPQQVASVADTEVMQQRERERSATITRLRDAAMRSQYRDNAAKARAKLTPTQLNAKVKAYNNSLQETANVYNTLVSADSLWKKSTQPSKLAFLQKQSAFFDETVARYEVLHKDMMTLFGDDQEKVAFIEEQHKEIPQYHEAFMKAIAYETDAVAEGERYKAQRQREKEEAEEERRNGPAFLEPTAEEQELFAAQSLEAAYLYVKRDLFKIRDRDSLTETQKKALAFKYMKSPDGGIRDIALLNSFWKRSGVEWEALEKERAANRADIDRQLAERQMSAALQPSWRL